MGTTVTVRDATSADANDLSRLLMQLGYPTEPHVAQERLARTTADGNGRIILAVKDGAVCGMITTYCLRTLHRPGDICRITALVVDASVRGAGIGRLLVEEVERYARETDCVRVEVTSAAPRTGAHAFYLRLGYIDYPKRFIKDL